MDNFNLKKYISENRLLKDETINEFVSGQKLIKHPEYKEFLGKLLSILDKLREEGVKAKEAKPYLERFLMDFGQTCSDIGYREGWTDKEFEISYKNNQN